MKRIPIQKYIKFKLENLALSLNNKDKLFSYIISPGFIYGYGEP